MAFDHDKAMEEISEFVKGVADIKKIKVEVKNHSGEKVKHKLKDSSEEESGNIEDNADSLQLDETQDENDGVEEI